MKQPNPLNELVRLFNHMDNHAKVSGYLNRVVRGEYVDKGLATPIEGDTILYRSAQDRDYAYRQFVKARHDLKPTPFALLGDEELLEMLLSGKYSYDELDMMNDMKLEEYEYECDKSEWDLEPRQMTADDWFDGIDRAVSDGERSYLNSFGD